MNTEELIEEAREWSSSYASWGDNGLVDRLADALEAANDVIEKVRCARNNNTEYGFSLMSSLHKILSEYNPALVNPKRRSNEEL